MKKCLAQASVHKRKRLKRRLIVNVLGDKGGVGKSLLARAIAALLRSLGYVVFGSDGDNRNAHLHRFYADSMEVMRRSLRSPEGWAEMYNDWQSAADADIILLDTPGNIGDTIERETPRFLAVAAALDRDIINIWVADEGEDSVSLLPYCYPLAAPSNTLFILNGRFNENQSAFKIWNDSQTRIGFIAAGGHEAYFPRLPISALMKIGNTRSPFDDVSAVNFLISEQVDFDIWWAGVNRALGPLSNMLGAAS